MPVTKNTQSGFTLIELLIAVMLLAIGMLGLAELQVTAMKTNAQSASSTGARALAQRYIERIAAMDSGDAMFDAAGTGTLDSGVSVEGAGTYDITYTVTRVTAAGEDVANLFRVQVDVENRASTIGAFGRSSRVATAYTFKRAI